MENNNITTIAIVGRPNVGKSTLFNRLIKKRQAIETSEAGTTRDRLYSDLFWGGSRYKLVDTAGLLYQNKTEIEKESQESTQIALEEADVILFVVDFRSGVTDQDLNISKKLRKKTNVLLVVNKCDSSFVPENLLPFKRLGIEKMVLTSAISGRNTGDLMDSISEIALSVPQKVDLSHQTQEDSISLSIIGRPNSGKSTLINTILGEKKMITSSVPGTTRDVQDFNFNHKGKSIILTDTAGIRKKSKVKIGTIEGYALLRSYRAIRESQVVIYMVDVTEGVVSMDQALLGEIVDEGKSMILAVNKIDLWPENEQEELMVKFIARLREQLNFMPWIPVVFISAKEKEHISSLLSQVVSVYAERFETVSEEEVTELLAEAKERNSQISYITSMNFVRANPPVFKILTRKNKKPHFSHLRYLENRIREVFPYRGNPIFIDWVKR